MDHSVEDNHSKSPAELDAELDTEFENAILEDRKLKKFKTKFKKESYCSNCGIDGHQYRECIEPITSFGVILVSISSNDDHMLINMLDSENIIEEKKDNIDENVGININNVNDINIFCQYRDNIKFLLVKRKHTLGFLEFIRGRYETDNVDGIIYLFKQMIPDEIAKIGSMTFDELWNDVWGVGREKSPHQNEYLQSKNKLEKLKMDNNGTLNLDFYVKNVIPLWTYAEWGFPKGRRNYKEDNLMCATREFKEEAGYCDDEFTILNNVTPMEENLIGTNGINYRHIYYTGFSTSNKIPSIDQTNEHQIDEIGDIGFFTYEEALKLIRPYHIDKRKILTQLYIYIVNKIIASALKEY